MPYAIDQLVAPHGVRAKADRLRMVTFGFGDFNTVLSPTVVATVSAVAATAGPLSLTVTTSGGTSSISITAGDMLLVPAVSGGASTVTASYAATVALAPVVSGGVSSVSATGLVISPTYTGPVAVVRAAVRGSYRAQDELFWHIANAPTAATPDSTSPSFALVTGGGWQSRVTTPPQVSRVRRKGGS